MKKLIAIAALIVAPLTGFAAGSAVELEHAAIDPGDAGSLQRGAKYYVNYCSGCHSLQYFRYEGLKALDLTEEEIQQNLNFSGGKLGDLMKISMPAAPAEAWFGAPAPDLTLVTRRKHDGADWLYSYLKGFYRDDSRPLGVNNTVFPLVGMPHVLWDLQGVQKAVFKEVTHEDGSTEQVIERLELETPGRMSPEEYDQLALDLTNFLAHVGEPMKQERQQLGIWVILFLVVFTILGYLLKKEYWKDIH
jgi:ubiquinol-cytochrome c reductase cytochrome c1 subunit